MTRRIRVFAAAALVLVVAACSGCSTFGVGLPADAQPQTPNERLLALETDYGAALRAVEKAVDGGILVGQRAQQAAAIVRELDTAMQTARVAVAAGDNTIAALNAANAVILRLHAHLAERNSP